MQPKALQAIPAYLRSFSLRLRVFAFFLESLTKKDLGKTQRHGDAKGRIWRVSKKFWQTRFLSST